jgi:tRNA U38,U39,U40 pseudouridine synthase TruA
MDFWAASLIMRNIALLPEYDGTAYDGWQVQKV